MQNRVEVFLLMNSTFTENNKMSDFKIYTKTGDDGTSGLIGGTRVSKFDNRLEAYGTVDELNSWIGLLVAQNQDTTTNEVLQKIQHMLFIIASHLATDTTKSNLHQTLPLSGDEINLMEKEIDRMQAALPELSNFILPGGNTLAAQTHIARTVCRRAERRATALQTEIEVEKGLLIFLNRLSDYLFALSRYFNFLDKQDEILWIPKKES